MLLPDDRCPADHRRGNEGFCPFSLTDWLDVARRTGVPHVPGATVAVFERDDLKHHEYRGPHQDRLDAAYRLVEIAADNRSMMRWDCCAPGSLKSLMASGATHDNVPSHVRNALPIDTRLLDILEDWSRLTLPAVKRPWLSNVIRCRAYPVEYRAFVRNGTVRGISAYYIQEPLRRNDAELREVLRLSKTLVKTVQGPFEWPIQVIERNAERAIVRKLAPSLAVPARDDEFDPKQPNCTMDFIVTGDDRAATAAAETRPGTGRVLFLEGGPPTETGAHPCCFGRMPPEGIKLAADDEPPLPLAIAE